MVQSLVPIPRYLKKKCVWLSLMQYLFFLLHFLIYYCYREVIDFVY